MLGLRMVLHCTGKLKCVKKQCMPIYSIANTSAVDTVFSMYIHRHGGALWWFCYYPLVFIIVQLFS